MTIRRRGQKMKHQKTSLLTPHIANFPHRWRRVLARILVNAEIVENLSRKNKVKFCNAECFRVVTAVRPSNLRETRIPDLIFIAANENSNRKRCRGNEGAKLTQGYAKLSLHPHLGHRELENFKENILTTLPVIRVDSSETFATKFRRWDFCRFSTPTQLFRANG